MKTSVIKTAIITILIMAILLFISFFGLYFFAPSIVSDLAYNVGANEFSVKISEKAYNQNNSKENLEKLVERSIEFENYSLSSKYLEILLNSSYYDDEDATYDYHLKSNFVYALYFDGQKDKAISNAFTYTKEYTAENNCVKVIIFLAYLDKDEDTLTKIKSGLKELTANDEIEKDLKLIDNFLNL